MAHRDLCWHRLGRLGTVEVATSLLRPARRWAMAMVAASVSKRVTVARAVSGATSTSQLVEAMALWVVPSPFHLALVRSSQAT